VSWWVATAVMTAEVVSFCAMARRSIFSWNAGLTEMARTPVVLTGTEAACVVPVMRAWLAAVVFYLRSSGVGLNSRRVNGGPWGAPRPPAGFIMQKVLPRDSPSSVAEPLQLD